MLSEWVKNIFKREVKNTITYSDREKTIHYKETGILGFKLIKKYISLNYKSYGIGISSHLEDDGVVVSNNNIIRIWFNNTTYTIKAPFSLVKPVLDANTNTTMNYGLKEKRYELFSVYEEGKLKYFMLYWNYVDAMLMLNKHKGWYKVYNVFWNNLYFIKRELLHVIDMKELFVITNLSSDEVSKIVDENPEKYYRIFNLVDYDGKDIQAKIYMTKATYIYGNSKLTRWIMKLFKKPISYCSYNISFSEEIGIGKEGWKGGTVLMAGPVNGNVYDVLDILSRKYNIPKEKITPVEHDK